MSQSRIITVNTKLSKDGTRIFAAPSPCSSSGSGGGGDCKVLTGNCPEPISCCMLATFGGSLAGIPPITLVYYPPGDYWGFGGSIGSPVVTPCGTITILEFISGGPAGFQLSLALNTFTSIATGYHTAGCPRSTDPGTYFIWESGDQVADAGSCAGTFTVTITETSCDGGGGSGSTGDYRIGVDTLLTKGGERIFAAVNCAASGPAAYRIGRDTGLSKGGKRIFAAELDPCCDGGPPDYTPVRTECCEQKITRRITATFTGSLSSLGTQILTWNGSVWRDDVGSDCWPEPVIITLTCIFFPVSFHRAFICSVIGSGATFPFFSGSASGDVSVLPFTDPPDLMCDPFFLRLENGVSEDSTGGICDGSFTVSFMG